MADKDRSDWTDRSDRTDQGAASEDAPTLFPELARTAVEARRTLPTAATERFQPLRAGILNLWQYDDQEFEFHDGRLLLRGENGSGKSKALELLLPFLLDADLSPHRLDPFASTARRMEWNLLEEDLHSSRIGYVWLELGRCESPGNADEAPKEIYRTLGCGLRASRSTRRVDAWYFLTERRIGHGLSLLGGDRVPLAKDALRVALGDAGETFDAGRDYRERLDAQIFGFGAERFAALRELLLQLRRPHLSEKLDPQALSGLLSDSLPPLDADLIHQISEGYERLEHDQAELNRIEAAARAVEEFLGVYSEYAWRPGEETAEAVRDAVRRLRAEPELLADSDRRALEAFFQGRIDAARTDAQAVPWREHLMKALDYRRWHEFRIQQRESGDKSWRDLTRRRHEASSGGEKAVALHLPLFAAAAAHYESALPTAPRLILLDEAFAGIDEGMRGRIMALLVEFKLDFLITSHDEWGCYAELPGLAIYQLYRDPALRGILAIRFVWDGRRRSEQPAG